MSRDNIIIEGYENAVSLKDIALNADCSVPTVMRAARRLGLTHPGRTSLKSDNGIMSTNSTLTTERNMRDATQAEQSRIEKLLEKNGYRPQWGIAWAHLEDEGVKTTVLLKNPQEIQQEEEWRDGFLKKVRQAAPKYRTPRKKKVTDGHLHLIDVADLHINKLGVNRDGSINYNADIAVERAHSAVDSLVTRGQGYNAEQFILPIGNDVLHTEGSSNGTSKGTPQTSDRHWTTAIDMAFTMYVSMVESLLTVAPVKIVHCRDNHAEFASYMLAKQLEAYLHRHKWLTSDISHLDRAYHQYGEVMIGMDHGHGVASAKLPQVVSAEQAAMWGLTKKRVFYRHHIHHADFKNSNVRVKEDQVLKDSPGITIQSMRSPSGTDEFHHNQGYVHAPKAIDSFIIHPTMGQVAHLTCPF